MPGSVCELTTVHFVSYKKGIAMERVSSLVLSCLIAVQLAGGCAYKGAERRSYTVGTAEGGTRTVTSRTVEAGCATCIYDMAGVEGCRLAVKLDGKPYLVTGAEVDAHGAGLCSAPRTAKVTGKIQGDKLVATSFSLQP